MAKQDDYVRYTIRLPEDLYNRVKDAAGEKSVNAEIAARLEASFDAPAPAAHLQFIIDQQQETIQSQHELIGSMQEGIRSQNEIIELQANLLSQAAIVLQAMSKPENGANPDD